MYRSWFWAGISLTHAPDLGSRATHTRLVGPEQHCMHALCIRRATMWRCSHLVSATAESWMPCGCLKHCHSPVHTLAGQAPQSQPPTVAVCISSSHWYARHVCLHGCHACGCHRIAVCHHMHATYLPTQPRYGQRCSVTE